MAEIVEKSGLPACLNALKHGLTAKVVVVSGEDATVWEAFERVWLGELAPRGAAEEFLAHRVAAAAWRLLRVERLEGSLASAPLEQVPALLAGRKRKGGGEWHGPGARQYQGLAILGRHESAIERSFFRSLSALRKLQSLRLRGSVGD